MRYGKLFVTAGLKGTIVNLVDASGKNIFSKAISHVNKNEIEALNETLDFLVSKAKIYEIHNMHLFIRGYGPASIIIPKYVQERGIRLTSIKDLTSIPHNACRPFRSKKKF